MLVMQTLKLVRCEWKCFAFLNNCQNFVTENFKLEMQTFAQFSKTLQHLALQSYTDHSTIPYIIQYCRWVMFRAQNSSDR